MDCGIRCRAVVFGFATADVHDFALVFMEVSMRRSLLGLWSNRAKVLAISLVISPEAVSFSF